MPALLYKSLAAKLVVGMPFKVYSYSMRSHKILLSFTVCGIYMYNFSDTLILI